MNRLLLTSILERAVSILAFYFPFVEIACYFGPKVFLGTESLVMRTFYAQYIIPLSKFYIDNNLLVFIVMIWLFTGCARGKLLTFRVSKFFRFNIIQAVLLNIIGTCIGVTFQYLPVVFRESLFATAFSNFLFLGMLVLFFYSSLNIAYGRYPVIPVISDAAKLNVQRGYD